MRFHRAVVAAVITATLLTACQQGTDITGGPADPGSSPRIPGDLPVSDAPGAGGPTAATGQASTRGVVMGRVLGADAAPVPGAAVLPRSLDVPAKPVPELVVVTDAKGAFEWRLEAGRYELIVNPPPGSSGTFPAQAVTVAGGTTVTVTVAPR
jgi:hypothetical protein